MKHFYHFEKEILNVFLFKCFHIEKTQIRCHLKENRGIEIKDVCEVIVH